MIERIIRSSVENKTITGALLVIFLGWGIWSVSRLSIDALPDVTNNQVQVITTAPTLATQEVEQFITYPLELQFKNLPDLVELRSISRSGLSVITIVFKDQVATPLARQLVTERLKMAEADIPPQFGTPQLLPPTTGLGEIFQYTLAVDSIHRTKYDAMELRTIQDWIVRRRLLGVPGVVDVSSFGGKLKQYEVAVDPAKLLSMDLSLSDVYQALAANNANTGGSYIEKGPNLYYIRGEGLVRSLDDIAALPIRTTDGIPIRVKDVAEVRFGHAPRFGAMTRNGEGETVGGVVLMMKGENAMRVIDRVKDRIAQVQRSLPEGVSVDVFVDRSKLIAKTTATVEENLGIGALIVVFVLLLVLGDLRAGLIVASVIPLSMLFAIGMMNIFGQSANLMSMGALDFGLIVDGTVIIVEATLFHLFTRAKGRTLTQGEMDAEVITSAGRIRTSAAFGEIIILIVYIPVFALVGVEGKMFRPMAFTVSFSIIGALLLSLTYVPFISSIVLSKRVRSREGLSERLVERIGHRYEPLLRRALRSPRAIVALAVALLLGGGLLFHSMGGEFIPELDEGDFATNYTIRQGSGLNGTIKVGTQLERILRRDFPEVKEVVSKIGSSEIPTDPMPIESADLIIVLKDKDEWTSARTSEELAEKMEQAMSVVPGVALSFEQPIQMRFNEMIAGVRSDIAIKLYGEDLDLLFKKGNEIAGMVRDVPGLVDLKVEQVVGMPQLVVSYDRDRLAQYGLSVEEANRMLTTALAGGKAGVVYEGEQKFDLVVRMAGYRDADIGQVKDIRVKLPSGAQVPMSEIAEVSFKSAPAQVSRDNGERRIVVQANVRGRDIQSVADDISTRLDEKLQLPSGYYLAFGGTFKNLQEAKGRLAVAVPVALLLIFFLLFLTFDSVREALLIFSAVPLAAVGGVLSLWLRGMPFSISAGVGFIALFGVAVLNGIVLISYFNAEAEKGDEDLTERIVRGTRERLRPVLATALVASLGFLPMALSQSEGSEVQRPLATVVIGGLITCTLLTLFVLPVLYKLFGTAGRRKGRSGKTAVVAIALLLLAPAAQAQGPLTLEDAVQLALRGHPAVQAARAGVEREEALRSTAFVLDPVDVQYQYGQINSDLQDYNAQALTGLAAPNTIARQAQALRRRTELAQGRAALTEAQVRREVGLAYVELQAARERQRLLAERDSIYRDFATFAERKVHVGESAPLEGLSARAEWERVKLDRAAADADVLTAEALLAQWTGTAVGEITGLEELPAPVLDSGLVAANPELRALARQVALSDAEARLERSRWTPSLKLGAFTQSLDHVTPRSGFIVGLSVPVFKTGRAAYAKAADIDARIAEEERRAAERALKGQLTAAIQDYLQRQRENTYYTLQGAALADALDRSAARNYQAGEIGYVEYIQTLGQAYGLRNGRIGSLLALDRSILQLNYLTGR